MKGCSAGPLTACQRASARSVAIISLFPSTPCPVQGGLHGFASYAVDVSEEFRSAAHVMVDEVADYLAALPSKPVWQPMPDDLRSELLGMPLPDQPAALEELVAKTSS